MVEESLRQKVFSFMDTNPEYKNKDVYNEFPGESENSLRTYRRDYFREKEKLISQVQVSEKNNISKVSEKPLSFQKQSKNYTHFCSLLNTYYHLPLFIYSRILKKAFDQVDTINDVKLSFYECFMSISNDVCNGYLDDSLIDFDSNVLEEMLRINAKIDSMDYLEFSEYDVLSEEYKDYKEWIEDEIELCKERVMGYMTNFNLINPTLKEYNRLISQMLYYLFTEQNFRRFYYRKRDIMKHDLNLIVQEYNNNGNSRKLNFIDEVRTYNCNSISVDVDNRVFTIKKDRYIDLGKHGEEFKGIHNVPYLDEKGDIIEVKEELFDTINLLES